MVPSQQPITININNEKEDEKCSHSDGLYEEKETTTMQWVLFVILLLVFWPVSCFVFCCGCETVTSYCNNCREVLNKKEGL